MPERASANPNSPFMDRRLSTAGHGSVPSRAAGWGGELLGRAQGLPFSEEARVGAVSSGAPADLSTNTEGHL